MLHCSTANALKGNFAGVKGALREVAQTMETHGDLHRLSLGSRG